MVCLQKKYNYYTDYRASSLLHRFLLNFDKSINLILPVNICEIVHEVVIKSGFAPLYIDISKKYQFTIDQEKLIDYLNKHKSKTHIVLLNQTYGVNFDFSALCKYLKTHYNVVIIEDKCLSIPSLETSEFADITLYSTGYAKIVDLPYGGGIAVSNHEIILPKSIAYFDAKKEYVTISIKDYVADIHNNLSKILEHKRRINLIYDSYLKYYSLGDNFNFWRYNIIVKDKNSLLNKIFSKKLFASSHYRPMESFSSDFRNSWHLYDNVLNLFNDFYITEDQAFEISQVIVEHDTI